MRYSYLKTSIIASALGLAALPALADASDVANAIKKSFYGKLNVSLEYLNADSYKGKGEANVSSNASRLGFKGEQKIDDKLSVVWQLESTVDVVNADWKLNRNTFLGLKTHYGTVRVGQIDTPFKTLWNQTDFFGTEVGDSRSITHAAHGKLDRRLKQSVYYTSPTFAGLTANIQYSANGKSTVNSADTSTYSQDASDAAVSASLSYQLKGWWIALAGDKSGSNVNSQRALRLASYYDFGKARVSGLYQYVKDANQSSTAYGVGTRFNVGGQWFLKGQYYRYEGKHNASDQNANMLAIGTDYDYSKNLRFYINASVMDNDNTYLTPFAVAHSANPSPISPKAAAAASNPPTTIVNPDKSDTHPYGVAFGVIYSF